MTSPLFGSRLLLAAATAFTLGTGSACVTRTVYVVDDNPRNDPPRAASRAAPQQPGPDDNAPVVAESDSAMPYEQSAGITSDADFYDPLAPYGRWVYYPGYGQVFVPAASVVGAGFRPYTNGHWEYTEWGWTWVDHHPFGWATGHYGRWFYDGSYGWVWVPGTTWSPAWVTWRTGGGYVGWAALPPGASYGGAYTVYDTSWVFVSYGSMGVAYIGSAIIVGPGYRTCYYETYPAYDTVVYNGRTYYRGPDYREVEHAGGHVIHRPAHEADTEHAVTRPPSGTARPRPGSTSPGRHDSGDPSGTSRPRGDDGRGGGTSGRGGDDDNNNHGRPYPGRGGDDGRGDNRGDDTGHGDTGHGDTGHGYTGSRDDARDAGADTAPPSRDNPRYPGRGGGAGGSDVPSRDNPIPSRDNPRTVDVTPTVIPTPIPTRDEPGFATPAPAPSVGSPVTGTRGGGVTRDPMPGGVSQPVTPGTPVAPGTRYTPYPRGTVDGDDGSSSNDNNDNGANNTGGRGSYPYGGEITRPRSDSPVDPDRVNGVTRPAPTRPTYTGSSPTPAPAPSSPWTSGAGGMDRSPAAPSRPSGPSYPAPSPYPSSPSGARGSHGAPSPMPMPAPSVSQPDDNGGAPTAGTPSNGKKKSDKKGDKKGDGKATPKKK